MAPHLEGRPGLSLGQARRSVVQCTDLREPVRGRGRRRLHPALVAAAQERRVTLAPPSPARSVGRGFRFVRTSAFGCYPIRQGYLRLPLFVRSLRTSSSGTTRSTWLTPSALASSNSVTTVGLRRPVSRP